MVVIYGLCITHIGCSGVSGIRVGCSGVSGICVALTNRAAKSSALVGGIILLDHRLDVSQLDKWIHVIYGGLCEIIVISKLTVLSDRAQNGHIQGLVKPRTTFANNFINIIGRYDPPVFLNVNVDLHRNSLEFGWLVHDGCFD